LSYEGGRTLNINPCAGYVKVMVCGVELFSKFSLHAPQSGSEAISR